MSDVLYPLPNDSYYYMPKMYTWDHGTERGRFLRLKYEMAINGGISEDLLNKFFLDRMSQNDIISFKKQLENLDLKLPNEFVKKLDEMNRTSPIYDENRAIGERNTIYPLPNGSYYFTFQILKPAQKYEKERLLMLQYEVATTGGVSENSLNKFFLDRMPQEDIESFKVQLEKMGLELPREFTKRLDELNESAEAVRAAEEKEQQLQAEIDAEKFYESRDLSTIDRLENVHQLREYMAETMGDPDAFINKVDGDLTKDQTAETIDALIDKMDELGFIKKSSPEHKTLQGLSEDFSNARNDNERSIAIRNLERGITDAVYSPDVKIDYSDMSKPWSDPFDSVKNKKDFVDLVLKGRLNDLLEPDDFADKMSSRLKTVERMVKYGMIEKDSKQHTSMIDSAYSLSEGKFAELCKNAVTDSVNKKSSPSSEIRGETAIIRGTSEIPSIESEMPNGAKNPSSIIYERKPTPIF